VNAEDVYTEIKAFLRYVGLYFTEMDKVTVQAKDDKLILSYGRTKTEIDLS